MAVASELALMIKADTKGVESGMKEMSAKFGEVGKNAENAFKGMSDAQIKAAQSSQRVVESQVKAGQAIEKYGKDSHEAQVALLDLAKAEKQATADADALNSRFGDLGTKFGGLGKMIVGAGIGAGIGMATEKIVEMGVAFDDVYDGMAIATGKTGKELEGLQQSFRNVVSQVPVDFETASAAVTTLSQRTGLTGEALDTMAVQVANLSRITGTDATAAANAAADVFNKLGVSADEQSAALDVMFAASQKSGIGFDQMAQSIGDAAPQFDMLGLSLSQGAGLMATLGKVGIDSGAVMKSVTMFAKDQSEAFKESEAATEKMVKAKDKQFAAEDKVQQAMAKYGAGSTQVIKAQEDLAKATAEAQDASDEFATAQENLQSAQGPMFDSLTKQIEKMKELGPGAAQNAIAFDLFGAKAGPQLVQALNSGTLSIEDFTAGLSNIGPGINETAASTDDMQQKFDLLKNKIMLAAEGFAPLGMAIQPFATMLPMLGGAIGGLAPIITGSVLPALGGLASSALAAVPAVLALAAPFLPIIVAVGAVVAIIAALKYAWDHNLGGIQEKTAAAVEWVKTHFLDLLSVIIWPLGAIRLLKAAWDSNLGGIQEKVAAVVDTIKGAFSGFVDFLSSNIETIKAVLLTILTGGLYLVWAGWQEYGAQITQFLTDMGTMILTKWTEFTTSITTALANIGTAIQTKWAEFLAAIQGALASIGEQIKLRWDAFLREIQDKLDAILGAITTAWEAMRAAVEAALVRTSEIINSVWDAIGNIIDAALSGIQDMVNNVLNFIEEKTGLSMDAVKAIFNNAMGAVRDAVAGVVAFFKGDWAGALSMFKEAAHNAIEAVKIAFTTMKDNVIRAVTAVIDFIGGFGDAVKGAFAGAADWLLDIGTSIVDGLKAGFQRAWNAFLDTIDNLINLLPDWLYKLIRGGSPARIMIPIGESLGQGIIQGFRDALDETAFAEVIGEWYQLGIKWWFRALAIDMDIGKMLGRARRRTIPDFTESGMRIGMEVNPSPGWLMRGGLMKEVDMVMTKFVITMEGIIGGMAALIVPATPQPGAGGGGVTTPGGGGDTTRLSARRGLSGVDASAFRTGRGGFLAASKTNYWKKFVEKWGIPTEDTARKTAAALGIPLPPWLEAVYADPMGAEGDFEKGRGTGGTGKPGDYMNGAPARGATAGSIEVTSAGNVSIGGGGNISITGPQSVVVPNLSAQITATFSPIIQWTDAATDKLATMVERKLAERFVLTPVP